MLKACDDIINTDVVADTSEKVDIMNNKKVHTIVLQDDIKKTDLDVKEYISKGNDIHIIPGDTEDQLAAEKYANHLTSLNLPVIYNLAHLAIEIGCSVCDLENMICRPDVFYRKATIAKKSGGIRTLWIPAVRLKMVQQWILENILNKLRVSEYAMGFCRRRSILTNANAHLGKTCVVNLDIKDFFPSITREQVFRVFYYYGYTLNLAQAMSKLCCYKGNLPQGAPTSPALSNIVCLKLDKRLSALANTYGATYTRYADDITFSGGWRVKNIIYAANEILNEEHFVINNRKTRISFYYQRQVVTGLIVSGKKVSVSKSYKRKLFQEIYYCRKYGVSDHLRHIGNDKRFYKDHMYGKACFLQMVDRELGKRALKELDELNWE